MGTIRVVFTGLLFGFIESISHQRHQALLAEIIRTVRITEWLPSGRRQDSCPGTATEDSTGKVLAPDKGIFFSTPCWFHSVFSVRTLLCCMLKTIPISGFHISKSTPMSS